MLNHFTASFSLQYSKFSFVESFIRLLMSLGLFLDMTCTQTTYFRWPLKLDSHVSSLKIQWRNQLSKTINIIRDISETTKWYGIKNRSQSIMISTLEIVFILGKKGCVFAEIKEGEKMLSISFIRGKRIRSVERDNFTLVYVCSFFFSSLHLLTHIYIAIYRLKSIHFFQTLAGFTKSICFWYRNLKLNSYMVPYFLDRLSSYRPFHWFDQCLIVAWSAKEKWFNSDEGDKLGGWHSNTWSNQKMIAAQYQVLVQCLVQQPKSDTKKNHLLTH